MSTQFQSPGGDLLFSDSNVPDTEEVSPMKGFNPLAGICCFQTQKSRGGSVTTSIVSIPWRGFVVFRLVWR